MIKSQKIFRIITVLVVLISNISCDQISKSVIRESLSYNEPVRFLNNHLTIVKVENTGAFLSLGNELPGFLRLIILVIMPSLMLFFGLFLLIKRTDFSRTTLVAISFIIAGGIGNIFDRIVYGSVTDFLHIDFIIFRTGVFNGADLSIITGVTIVIIHSLLSSPEVKRNVNFPGL